MGSPGDDRTETPYVREPGYAERYRDRRFTTGSGRGTHRREVRAMRAILRVALRPPSRPGPWLDAPAGAGRMSEQLPEPVFRIDRSAEMLRAAPGAGRAACASVHALPFADGTFAGALCHRLLHHLPTSAERVAVLAELRRVTDGPIVVSFFHAVSVQNARRSLARHLGKRRSGRCAITLRRFQRDLWDAGLRIRRVVPLLPLWSEQWLVLAEPRPGATDAP